MNGFFFCNIHRIIYKSDIADLQQMLRLIGAFDPEISVLITGNGIH